MDGSKMGCSALIPRRVWNAGDDWYWAKLGDRRTRKSGVMVSSPRSKALS